MSPFPPKRFPFRRLREILGVALQDVVSYERALRADGDEKCLLLCNRSETLRDASSGSGVECLWTDSAILHEPTVWPPWGLRLMRRARLFLPALQKHRLIPGYFALTGLRRKILGRKAGA